MTFCAITITPDGNTTCRTWTITDEVRVPEHLQRAVGALVDVVALAPDLGMWTAAYNAGSGYNPVATAIAASHGAGDRRYFGTVVLTGGSDERGATTSLSSQRSAALLAEVDHVLATYTGQRATTSA